MQKLDLVRNIRILSTELKAAQIYTDFTNGLKIMVGHPNNPNSHFNGETVAAKLIESKSVYDRLLSEPRHNALPGLLDILGAKKVYDTAPFKVIMFGLSSPKNGNQLTTIPWFFDVLNLHGDIIRLEAVCSLLISDPNLEKLAQNTTGITVFQITNHNADLPVDTLTSILKLIDELIAILSAVYCPDVPLEKPTIVLLDSGSLESFGVKTGVQVAEGLFKVFKEVFDFALNHKHYKTGIEMETLVKNISVLGKIAEAKAQGTLPEAKAQEYSALIIRKTDDLIGLKVLPKQIVDAEIIQQNVDLLQEYPSIKFLRSSQPDDLHPPSPASATPSPDAPTSPPA